MKIALGIEYNGSRYF
ncbi:tRNA pseudouridine synthase A, partial [Yersinia pestis PY-92]